MGRSSRSRPGVRAAWVWANHLELAWMEWADPFRNAGPGLDAARETATRLSDGVSRYCAIRSAARSMTNPGLTVS